jgi:hypothetical protein
MPDPTVDNRFNPKDLSAAELQTITADFLKLDWVQNMGMYVRIIKSLGLPPEPENQQDMKKENSLGQRIFSVPELMDRARGNADRWEPLLKKMGEVAGGIQLYAETSVITIEVLIEDQENYGTKTDKKKQQFKKDFLKAVDQLKKIAILHKEKAVSMQDEVLKYSKAIESDHDMSKDIQSKYAKWLEAEEKQLEAWEKSHNVPRDQTGSAMIKKFEDMVADYKTKWAGLSSGAGAAAAATATIGIVVFPPFGTIASFFAMTSLAVAAEEMRKLMVQFQGFLDQVQRFHAVKLFFNTLDKDFTSLREQCAIAIQALGKVAGQWETIAQKLENIGGKANVIDPLVPTAPEEWEESISRIARRGADKTYKDLIEECKNFTRYMYVRNIIEVKFNATGSK